MADDCLYSIYLGRFVYFDWLVGFLVDPVFILFLLRENIFRFGMFWGFEILIFSGRSRGSYEQQM